MKKISIACMIACSFVVTGCATIFGGGPSQTVNLVPSDGKPHTVSVQAAGQAPYDLDIPKAIPVSRSRKDIVITVKDSVDGEIGQTEVKSKMNPWFLGDIVALSLLSSSVDFLSGAVWKYDENATVNVTKEAVASAAKAEAEEKARMKQEEEEKKKLDEMKR